MKRAASLRTRSVHCTDSFGCNVNTTITVDSTGNVFVSAPPGETGWFDPNGVVELVAALNAALGIARSIRTYRQQQAKAS